MVRINTKRKINYMKKKTIINFLILLSILFLFIPKNAYTQSSDKLYEKIDLFSEVLEKIQDEYVEEVDQSEVMDSAINGVLQSLDPIG